MEYSKEDVEVMGRLEMLTMEGSKKKMMKWKRKMKRRRRNGNRKMWSE